MLVQIIRTKKGKVYVRLFGRHHTFIYEEDKEGHLDPCAPPKPGKLAGAHVQEENFEAAFWN